MLSGEKKCPGCDKTFEGGRADRTYCSERCGSRERKRRYDRRHSVPLQSERCAWTRCGRQFQPTTRRQYYCCRNHGQYARREEKHNEKIEIGELE